MNLGEPIQRPEELGPKPCTCKKDYRSSTGLVIEIKDYGNIEKVEKINPGTHKINFPLLPFSYNEPKTGELRNRLLVVNEKTTRKSLKGMKE